MNQIKKEMIDIYETYDYDWMNYKIIDNDITYHHIQKVEDGGLYTFENGALLTSRAHKYLHFIENVDNEIYQEINEVLKDINTKKEVSYYQRNKIQLLLLKFEIRNVNRIIKKKEKLGKKRLYIAYIRRLKKQELL